MKFTKITVLTCLIVFFSGYKPKHLPAPRSAAEPHTLFLPDDLEATLWAESPQFYNPTNIDIDSKGRVWVAEAVNYRDFNNSPEKVLHHPEGDRIMILEDTDGDGKSDRSKVFVQDKDLISPLGVAVIGNQVIVSCSPAIIIYTDINSDDKPDKKEILLQGFGGRDHDHGVHSFLAGPDGRWYFNTGNAGPHLVQDKAGWNLRSGSLYTGGSPYAKSNQPGLVSDDGNIWVGGLALRIGPDGRGLEVVGHNFRNAYELAVDSYGNMWQNDNDDQVVACRTSWVMEGGNAGYFSTDGTRYWQPDRRPGQKVFTAHWHQDDPGVQPAGDNTGAGSPTGITVNESDALGEKYRGMLLSADAGRNVIFGYHPQAQGAGFAMPRLNFISSLKEASENYVWHETVQDETKWFRPSDVAIGTDGAIYVADWYDPIVGGHQMQDAKGHGRIYRITPKGKNLKAPRYNLETTDGQMAALLSPAVNVRYSGYQALRAQGNKAIEPLKKVLLSTNSYYRARAVWLLAALGRSGQQVVEKLLQDGNADIRLTALRALRSVKSDVLPYAAALTNDPSTAVRREVALALKKVPFTQSKEILLELAKKYDGTDRMYLEALGLGMTKKEAQLYPVLLAQLGHPEPLQWSESFADLIWRLHPVAAVNAVQTRAASGKLTEAARKQALETLAFTKDATAAAAMVRLSNSNLADVAQQADWWLQFRALNDWSKYALTGWAGVSSAKGGTLNQKMVALQALVLDTLKPQKERLQAALAMAPDQVGGQMLVSLAAQRKLEPSFVQEISQVIFTNPDQTVRTLAGDYFKRPDAFKKLSMAQIGKLQPEVAAGKALFQGKCATCHRVGNTGADIGPELTFIRQKFDKSGLLDAVINPSAAMAFGYETWVITTKNGNTIYGFLQADGETVILKDTSGKRHQIKAQDIASRKQFTTSIMPDPATLKLSEQDLANVSEYLLTFSNKEK